MRRVRGSRGVLRTRKEVDGFYHRKNTRKAKVGNHGEGGGGESIRGKIKSKGRLSNYSLTHQLIDARQISAGTRRKKNPLEKESGKRGGELFGGGKNK